MTDEQKRALYVQLSQEPTLSERGKLRLAEARRAAERFDDQVYGRSDIGETARHIVGRLSVLPPDLRVDAMIDMLRVVRGWTERRRLIEAVQALLLCRACEQSPCDCSEVGPMPR
jgi:hypothetical protein